jgi:signal transduction histidine kinase
MVVPQQDLVLLTDRRALTQILLNLANNAIKFTETGEVQIVLGRSTERPLVTVISVTDTGIGIRPEDQSRLFQAFQQINEGGLGRQKGTGLGLHLSQKLANLLGGQILFRSEYGKGSTFTLALRDR